MLDPPLFERVIMALRVKDRPEVDAFAEQHNAQLPHFWSPDVDAFTKDWWGTHPLWANPPFSMLTRVLYKVKTHGGYIILLAPEWSPALPGLVALAHRSFLLPDVSPHSTTEQW